MKIIIAAAVALTVSQAFATTTAKPAPQPTVQAQIEALKSQVAALQSQVDKLKAGRVQQVCISLKCA
jgi:uncharacterized protein YceH (UPF0502 family)